MAKWDDILNPYSSHPRMRILIHILLLLSTTCSAISLTLIFLAVTPYLLSLASKSEGTSAYQSDLYFGDIAKYNTAEEFSQKAISRSEKDLIKDLTYQIHTLSTASVKKFDYLSVAIWFVALGEVFPMALLLFLKISVSIGK